MNTRQETCHELIARLMFDNNITIEILSEKTKIPVSHIKAILEQDKDTVDTECLFNALMANYRPIFARLV